jgi:DNA methylase
LGEGKFSTAEKRWAGIGPYYAMFPAIFADKVIKKYTQINDTIIDPFAGRATSIYSAATQGRFGIGVELNPVGWVYGKTKLSPANRSEVQNRITQLAANSLNRKNSASELPEFFHLCFCPAVLNFLMTARAELDWNNEPVDWTVMGLLLVYLHGKRGQSFSNQMRQTKAMAPAYAIKWWNNKGLKPPEVDPVQFMDTRIKWRYSKGIPTTHGNNLFLGDCIEVLDQIKSNKLLETKAKLVLTSPPYYGVTNYFYDQWIRLWLLGNPPEPDSSAGKYKSRFQSKPEYTNLIEKAFTKISPLMAKDCIVYVRTDARAFTLETTLHALEQAFPNKKIKMVKRPIIGTTQTHLFGDYEKKCGEVDLIAK